MVTTFSTTMLRCLWLALSILLSVSVSAAERRGTMAFHYGGPLTPAQLEWFGRFDVLVTHDPLPRQQVKVLRERGTRLALYEWSVAFYRSLVVPGSWHDRLLRDQSQVLLNRRALRGHAGAADADAFYYDPAVAAHTEGRVRALVQRLRVIGYDGVFFDTTTFQSVHPDALAEYERRHSDLPYDAAFARFLAALRRELRLIITNQGYRSPEHYLPYVDYDVSESLLTRPWHDPDDRWNSVDFLMPELILKPARRYPHVRFVHLNYVDGHDSKAIESILATARLFDHDAYVATADVERTLFSDLYFIDLGRPVSEIEDQRGVTSRKFERGRVVVTPKRARIERALP